MRLVEIAHARSGDKGDIADITVVARDPRSYTALCEELTIARVEAHLHDLGASSVKRYEVPTLSALKFVLFDALDGGVTRALTLDAHGKCLSSCLLDMEIPDQGGTS